MIVNEQNPAPADGPVVCVAANLALDITYISERFVPGEVNRVGQLHTQAGGKAVNVARLLHASGHGVVVTGLAGGLAGAEIAVHLDRWAIPHRLVASAADSRRTISAYSASDAAVTAYYEDGPSVTAAEWEQLTATAGALLPGASAVVLSGSLPAGAPQDGYRELAAAAAAAGASVFLDAHPKPLLAALEASPALVKPNEPELAEAAGLTLPLTLPGAVAGARLLLEQGAQAVVATLGPRGLVAVLADRALHAAAPPQHGNPVGAGDAALAALVAGHLAGQPWPQRLRRAAAQSAAAVRQPVAGVASAADVAELEVLTEVREL